MRMSSWLAAAAASVLVLSSVSSHATLVLHRTPAQLGDDSSVVVRGVVQNVVSYWNPQRTRILTGVEIRVDATYKGEAPATVHIEQLGGEVDGVRMTAAGALQWRRGEEVLVFVESVQRSYRVAGFSQGKFELERDPATRELYVSRPAAQGRFVEKDSGQSVDTPAALRMPLRELLAEALPNYEEGR